MNPRNNIPYLKKEAHGVTKRVCPELQHHGT